jgi:adenylate cyclase
MNIDDEKKFTWKQLTGVLIAVLTVILIELLFNTTIIPDIFGTNIFQAIERRSFDLLMQFRGVRPNAGDVIMIRIDEYTDKQLGWPIPRDQYGAIMALLSNSGAKAVVLDVTLPPQNDADSVENTLLVQYLAHAHNTFQVFGPYIPSRTEADQVSRRDVDSTAHYVIGRFGIPAPRDHHFLRSPFIDDYPFPELAKVSTSIGHALVIPDTLDGVIRSMPLFIEYAGRLYPSIGFAVALKTLNIQQSHIKFVDTEYGTDVYADSLLVHTGLMGEVMINYVGKGENFPSVSFYDILAAAKERDVKFFDQFKGKVCIIGPTIRSIGDYYATPLEESSAGYLTHANLYDMIITDSFISQPPSWLQFLILICITIAISFIAHTRKLKTGFFILIIVTALYLAFAVLAFSYQHLWFNVAEPLSGLLICFVATVVYRAATEGRQRKFITEMFGTYVDSNVVQILINNPTLAQLGGERHEISIMFTDIQGFSKISEDIPEDALVKLLNVYFTDMTNVILENGGSVDKFIGDSIMAFWGAPIIDRDSAYNACATAIQLQKRLTKLQPRLTKISQKEMKQRIGINTGVCIVGNMGSEQKKNYTVMGDPVNLASRLEGVNKQYGTGILISEYTFQKVAKRVITREVDRVQVVGKTEGVRIYELLDLTDKPLSEKMKNFLDMYGQGLTAYQERRWDEGIAFMEQAMHFIPEDSVCQLYIERMKLYKLNPPADNWNGVFILQSK